MCLFFVPLGRKRFKLLQKAATKGKQRTKFHGEPKKSKQTNKKTQLTLEDCFRLDYIGIEEKCQETLEAFGDPLAKKKAHHIRFLFQNVNGISINEGLHVMTETSTIGALQADIATLVETNKDWNQSTRDKISHQLWSHLGHSRVVCASNVSKRPEDG